MARAAALAPGLGHERDLVEGLEPPASEPVAARNSAPPLERLIGGQYWRWFPLAGLWFAFALLIAFGVYVSYAAQGNDVGLAWVLYATIPHFLVWTAVSPPLYRALYEAVEGTRRLLAVVMLTAWSVIAVGGSTVFCYLGISLRGGNAPSVWGLFASFIEGPLGPPYQAMNSTILILALAAFATLLALRQRGRAQWLAEQAALRDARMQARLAESRLRTLQARINPHFLLNSLNAIAGFVQTGRRDDAFDAVARLGSLLRTALDHGDSPDVSLGEELDFASSYMELLKMRFGEAFRYSLSAPESLRGHRVPALVVQPLIENAVQHGMQARQTLTVEVNTFTRNGRIVVEVADDGRGVLSGGTCPTPPGRGLANVAERLRLAFGDRGSVELRAREPRGAVARLSFAA